MSLISDSDPGTIFRYSSPHTEVNIICILELIKQKVVLYIFRLKEHV